VDNQQIVDTFGAETHRSLQARDWKAGVANQDIGQEGFLVGYQTRADEKNGNFSITEAEVANSLSALWPGDTSHRSMTLVQAVIQDSREMANKTQNGAGFSTEDISYTLTGVDRQAVAHSAGAPAVFRRVGPSAYRESKGLAGPNLASGGDVGGGSENIMTFSAHLTDASAEHRQQNLSLLTQGDAAVLLDSVGGTEDEDDLLPVGLDSHRYRCCGNGVVAPVAEWIGRRIVEVDRRWREEEAK
jgi:site-specific DNA-cytosine methylase